MLKVCEENHSKCRQIWKEEVVLEMVPLPFAVERAEFMESFWWLEGTSGDHKAGSAKAACPGLCPVGF